MVYSYCELIVLNSVMAASNSFTPNPQSNISLQNTVNRSADIVANSPFIITSSIPSENPVPNSFAPVSDAIWRRPDNERLALFLSSCHSGSLITRSSPDSIVWKNASIWMEGVYTPLECHAKWSSKKLDCIFVSITSRAQEQLCNVAKNFMNIESGDIDWPKLKKEHFPRNNIPSLRRACVHKFLNSSADQVPEEFVALLDVIKRDAIWVMEQMLRQESLTEILERIPQISSRLPVSTRMSLTSSMPSILRKGKLIGRSYVLDGEGASKKRDLIGRNAASNMDIVVNSQQNISSYLPDPISDFTANSTEYRQMSHSTSRHIVEDWKHYDVPFRFTRHCTLPTPIPSHSKPLPINYDEDFGCYSSLSSSPEQQVNTEFNPTIIPTIFIYDDMYTVTPSDQRIGSGYPVEYDIPIQTQHLSDLSIPNKDSSSPQFVTPSASSSAAYRSTPSNRYVNPADMTLLTGTPSGSWQDQFFGSFAEEDILSKRVKHHFEAIQMHSS